MEIFGAMFNTNIVGGYDVKKKKQAFIEVDTIPIISGFIQLKNVYIQKEVYSDFEIAFFGEGADLSKTLASKLISDLDLSAYDHTATVENIQDSWTGDLFTGKIRYGIIDKGQNWSQVIGTPINALSPIYAGELTPFFRVYELTKEILEQNGFYLTSDFLSAQTNFYLPCSNGNRFLNTSIPYDAFRFQATLGTTNDVTLSSGNTVGSINAVEVYDPENLYTSDYFTPTYTGDFTFVININVENQTAGNCLTQILIANNADLTDNQVVFSQMVTQGNTVVTTAQVTATLTAGEEYSLYYNLLGQSGGTFSINAGTSWTLTFGCASVLWTDG
jgi:hypothetical protein